MKTPTYEQDLKVCIIGKCRIYTDNLGRPVAVEHGRVRKFATEARDYVAARPKLEEGWAKWLQARREAIAKWKHETPHFRYDCDGGALAVRLNGNAVIKITNGVGDGNFPVYLDPPGDVPPTFELTDLNISGPCAVEPLNYDCTGGEPLVSYNLHKGESMWVYRDGSGAIVLKK